MPDAVIDREKGYFPVPALSHLEEPVLGMVREALLAPEARERGLFRPDVVEAMLADPNAHRTNLDGSTLWQLGLLELWLQQHVRMSAGAVREVVVVGGGQAGLAMGHHLARRGFDFTILDAGDGPAEAWRGRWDSLRLFTPARRDALPGRPFPGDPDRYPTRDEVVAYLTDYAAELPVEYGSRVRALRRDGEGFRLELDDRIVEARQVVVATGPFQVPRMPAVANGLSPEVRALHSSAYRRPADLPDGPVLVVGGGNTGFQIAEELAATREVHLAIGSRQTPMPQRMLGRDLFDWLVALGVMRVTTRLADRPADERARGARRLQPARRAPARHRAAPARGLRVGRRRRLRGRHAGSSPRP